jgi:hypothetical protein
MRVCGKAHGNARIDSGGLWRAGFSRLSNVSAAWPKQVAQFIAPIRLVEFGRDKSRPYNWNIETNNAAR